MASLIRCPHCGLRPREEFTIRGSVPGARPAGTDDPSGAEWMDYVHLRDNPKGVVREHWYHGSGCGRWLEVARHTVSHAVLGVEDVQAGAAEAARP